ncbi:MAG: TIGR00153 family protein [Spirochaetes bacterium GWB1_36_13]|nr:MAG: TIGR00153 family protein [Spirochaetes bacterium GWB1_36_13]
MKNILTSLFGQSPFKPLQAHAEQIFKCVKNLENFLKILRTDFNEAKKVAEEVSLHEHEADKIKDKIRDNLGKPIFMPVGRDDLLEILSIQDAIADSAEDVAVLAVIKENFSIPEEIFVLMEIILQKSTDTFLKYKEIIDQMDELLEATFSGPQADKIRKNIETVALYEHETDKAQKMFLKKLFEYDDRLTHSDFFLISNITKRIGDIANISEKAANKIRLILLK